MTDRWTLVGSVGAVVIAVALPRRRYAAACADAFETVLSARQLAIAFIVTIRTIAVTVTDLDPGHAHVAVCRTLELTLLAEIRWAVLLVGRIGAVLFPVAHPVDRYTLLVASS